jgi:hypothetical protein
MQTFIPSWDLPTIGRVLDRQRLGKQRVECVQILRSLDSTVPGRGWANHPAVRMWRGHEAFLLEYTSAVCEAWSSRGYRNVKIADHLAHYRARLTGPAVPPAWWGDDRVLVSHRSNLIRKHAEHYQPMWPNVPDNLPYYWPTKEQS